MMARMRDKSKEKRTKRRGGGSKYKCNPATTAVCMTAKDERLIRLTRGDEAYWWLTGGSEKTFDL